jgi:hypothetical protein
MQLAILPAVSGPVEDEEVQQIVPYGDGLLTALEVARLGPRMERGRFRVAVVRVGAEGRSSGLATIQGASNGQGPAIDHGVSECEMVDNGAHDASEDDLGGSRGGVAVAEDIAEVCKSEIERAGVERVGEVSRPIPVQIDVAFGICKGHGEGGAESRWRKDTSSWDLGGSESAVTAGTPRQLASGFSHMPNSHRLALRAFVTFYHGHFAQVLPDGWPTHR